MSLFDELAGLWLRIQPLGGKPYQWIYAVDDAWFHPDGCQVEIKDKENETAKKCAPVFSFSLVGKDEPISDQLLAPPENATADAGNGGLALAGSNSGSDSVAAATLETLLRASLSQTGSDRDVVEQLFRFILDEHGKGHRYGICFCSFEWFWRNITEIDLPQNAVLFDIRHGLGRESSKITRTSSPLDLGELRDDWKSELEKTGHFSEIQNHMDRLGWYLHYCLKFAKVPGQADSRPAIADNHIQIVSSAVNPGSGRSDAMSDYSQVQEFIWAKLAPLGGTPVDDITPDRFTFSPMPKGGAMKTGLAIFNNSFRHAANWNVIKAQWCKEIKSFYGFRSDGHYASDTEATTDAPTRFRWKTWFPVSGLKQLFDPLYINHKYYNGGACTFLGIRINGLLKLLAHSGVREFPKSWSGFDNRDVTLPSCPGLVVVFLLIELAHALGPKDARSPVKISYHLDDAVSPKLFTITFTLSCSGITELKHCYENEKRSGDDKRPVGTATTSLWKLVSKRAASGSSHELPEKATFDSLVGQAVTFCSEYPKINWKDCSVSISFKAT